jgi:3-hydroxy-9,10-secoandrosta-1,3,5(10)-triene-9,17-dione monooxygenase
MNQTITRGAGERVSGLTKTEPQNKAIPTAGDLIAAARDLIPYLREHAAQCETDRRVSVETIQKLQTAGLFNVVKPKRYGGYELGWDVFSEIVIAIASGCGSTGWVYSVVGGHAPVVARFGTDLLDELWRANPDALISSCRRGSGSLVPVTGGYRGTGTGLFSSGCLNADWVIVEGIPVEGENRAVTVFLPTTAIEILDTWKAIGLAGTGSHDLRFTEIFIPEHRVWHPGKKPHGEMLDGPLFRTAFLGGPFALPSVVVGIAVGGLEQFLASVQTRVSRQGGSLGDLQSMQMRVGEAAVEIDAALALLRAKLKELMTTLSGEAATYGGAGSILPAGGTVHGYDQAATGFIAHTAYMALNRLMVAAGANQLSVSAPFQRCFRDALAGTQQPSNNWDNGRTMGGRDLIGRHKA